MKLSTQNTEGREMKEIRYRPSGRRRRNMMLQKSLETFIVMEHMAESGA